MYFLRENGNVCSTTLTEHRPLKRGRQISQHLLIHPNLRSIIVPQPCRKRSVTLGDCPATHLSNFTLLSSRPFFTADSEPPPDSEEILATRYLHSFALKPFDFHCSPRITLRAEEKVLCLRASFLFPYGYDNITLCRTCCYYKRAPCSVYVEDS